MYLISFAVLFAFAMSVQAQSSACTRPADPEATLTICTHERGMAPRPQPQLYLRLFPDGRAEYEQSAPGTKTHLITKQFLITHSQLNEILCLGREPDFQAAEANYPAIHKGIDSSRETTITFRDGNAAKQIVLHNYWPNADDNVGHYPSSLNALMMRAADLRDRELGIVRPIPTITYCELLKNRHRYVGKMISIHADLTYFVTTTRDGKYSHKTQYLYDPECDSPQWGTARTTEKIAFTYTETQPVADALRAMAERIRSEPFYSRARVLVTGILKSEPGAAATGVFKGYGQSGDNDGFTFEIHEFKSIDPIILPYAGTLQNGWTYSDTIRHPGGYELKLSLPIKPPLHHSAAIEWRNAEAFPALKNPGLKGLTFRIISTTTQMIAPNRWNTTYNCDILEITSDMSK